MRARVHIEDTRPAGVAALHACGPTLVVGRSGTARSSGRCWQCMARTSIARFPVSQKFM